MAHNDEFAWRKFCKVSTLRGGGYMWQVVRHVPCKVRYLLYKGHDNRGLFSFFFEKKSHVVEDFSFFCFWYLFKMFHLGPDLLWVRLAPLHTAVPRLLGHELFFLTAKTFCRGNTPLAAKKKTQKLALQGALLYVVNTLGVVNKLGVVKKLGHWGSSEARALTSE